MSLALYFAYGSNLNPEQMKARCPTSRWFSVAKLPGYTLLFMGSSSAWGGGGVASLVPRPGATTHGVIYAMKPRDFLRLDAYEGHPYQYRRVQRVVTDDRGEQWRVHTYEMPAGRARALPSERYIDVIERAYLECGFETKTLWNSVEESA